MKAHRPVKTALFLAAWLGLASLSADAAYVILANGTRVDGTSIRARSDGTVVLETAMGSQTFARNQYSKAVADKPPEIDEASRLVGAQQFDQAIKLLEEVAAKFRFLDWDVHALKLLPQIYERKGDSAGAIQAYENLFRLQPRIGEESEVLFGYFGAMLKAQQYEKLDGRLDDVIAKGSRKDAARAQLLRGDLKAAQNQLEAAVLDYLRTAILFKAEAEVQPAALFKAAETLEKLRDNRAKEFYQRVVSEHPASPEAARARTKLQG
jgi:tetratricopeptide (TPR) repeat protein